MGRAKGDGLFSCKKTSLWMLNYYIVIMFLMLIAILPLGAFVWEIIHMYRCILCIDVCRNGFL